MKIPRIDTGICPRCGSDLTARLRKGTDGSRAFHFGSPVVYASDPGYYNCACAACGVRWTGYPKITLTDSEKIYSMKMEWIKLQAPPDPEEEKEILSGMADDLGLFPPKKKRGSGRLKRAAELVAKETISSPVRSIRSLADDITGSINGEDNRKENDE